MKIPPELLEALKRLPHVIEEYSKSEEMSHSAVEQLEALLPSHGESMDDPLENLAKIIDQDDDTIQYASAIRHAQKHVNDLIEHAHNKRSFKIRKFFSQELRRQAPMKDEIMRMAITA